VNKAIGEYLKEPEAIDKFTKIGQTPAHTTPEGFHDIVVREEALWRDLIHKYGITNQ
jgi:tripartite-type tricarboxylate transporter receptor subunit TctC